MPEAQPRDPAEPMPRFRTVVPVLLALLGGFGLAVALLPWFFVSDGSASSTPGVVAGWQRVAGALIAAACLIYLCVVLMRERHASEALVSIQEREARFAHLTRLSTDWFWETGLDGRFVRVEGGGSASERKGMSTLMGILPWDSQGLVPISLGWEEVKAAQSRREPYRQTLAYQLRDGNISTGTLEVVGEPRFDASGAYCGYRGIARDITARVNAQQTLERMAAENAAALDRLELIVRSMPIAFTVVDAQNRRVMWNPEAERVFGYSAQEALGQDPFNLHIPQDQLAMVQARYDKLKSGQAMVTGVNRSVTRSGKMLICQWRNARITDAQGGYAGAIAMAIDVTVAHREELWRKAEHRLFDSLAAGAGLPELMTILCEAVESVCEMGVRCAVNLIIDGKLRHCAAPHVAEFLTRAADGLVVGEESGTCGLVALKNCELVTANVLESDAWRGFTDLAIAAQVAGCWSTPIHGDEGEVVATFAAYVDRVRQPAEAELEFTRMAAQQAALIFSRFKAREALSRNEARFRHLVQLASDWEWERDREFRLTHLRSWQEPALLDAPSLLGQPPWDSGSKTLIDEDWARFRERIERREPFEHAVVEYRRPDGRRAYVSNRGAPFHDADGNFSGYRGVGVDVSKRFRADRIRTVERALFEAMAKGTDVAGLLGIVASGLSNVLERAADVLVLQPGNAGWESMAAEPAITPLAQALVQAAGVPDVRAAFDDVMRNGAPLFFEAFPDDGVNEWHARLRQAGVVSLWVAPIRDGLGLTLGLVCVCGPAAGLPAGADLDWLEHCARLFALVVERARITDMAEEAAERYRRLVEFSLDGVLIHEWGKIIYANPAFVRMMGATDGRSLQGHTVVEMFVPEDRSKSAVRLAHLRATGEPIPYVEMRLLRQDGSELEVEVGANLFEAHGVRLIQTQFRDIGERKESEREVMRLNAELELRVEQRTMELTAANRELEAFSYTVAHDLRAPLRAIDGFSQMLKLDAAASLSDDARRDVDAITSSARKMAELIEGLLNFSRLSRTGFTRQMVPTRLLVDSLLQETPGVDRIDFHIGPLPDSWGDAGMLRQVWTNLISNAVKFSAKVAAPSVEIFCELRPEVQVFHVRDNGSGFDARYAGKLFGVFQRLHTESEFEGTGVGLAIVKRIIERHGGSVGADSSDQGGATFWFAIPYGSDGMPTA